MGQLTALHIKNAKPGRYADGDGLYLLVSPTPATERQSEKSGKSWVLRIQINGKRKDYGLGSLRELSAAEAREKALQWRKIAKLGRNPSEEWKRQNAVVPTFKEAAEAYHESRKGSWKNSKHADQWITTLRTYAFPVIGKLTVDRIDAAQIQSVLIPIWQEKPETARRVRQRIGTVLDHSKAMGWRISEAPMRAVGTLLKGLKQPKAKNFAAMPYKAVPAFLNRLVNDGQTTGKFALRFLILTAARSGEVRGATWSEINLEQKVWTIPAGRMKMAEEHAVPLSPAAIGILTEAKTRSAGKPDGLIFPGLRRKPLSDMTLSKVLRTNGGEAYTVHGFRSSFRDWCAETGINNDWAEAALAHSVANRVEAAYRRTKFLDQRITLMNDWAKFCTQSAATGSKLTTAEKNFSNPPLLSH